MIHFTLFGIPIYIRPTFWIVLAIFGGILGVSSVESLIYPALFVIAGFIAILSHELGHALVGRKLGGGQQTIILELFGGVTSSHGMQLTRARTRPDDSGGSHDDAGSGRHQHPGCVEHRRPRSDRQRKGLLGSGALSLSGNGRLSQAVHPLLPHHDRRMVDCPQPASHLSPGRRPAGLPNSSAPPKKYS